MNKILSPWILFFMIICAVVMVWSGDYNKLDKKAAGGFDRKRLQEIASLRRVQQWRRSSPWNYKVCLRTSNGWYDGTEGNILINLQSRNRGRPQWKHPVVFGDDNGIERGSCHCQVFRKPALPSVLPHKVIIQLAAGNTDRLRPYTFEVLVRYGQRFTCSYEEKCSRYGSCVLYAGDVETIQTCHETRSDMCA